jgi:uncharacterized protein
MGNRVGKVYLKIHLSEKGAMVAMCDEELIGKRLTEGKKELDLDRYADFYRGDLIDEKEAMKEVASETIYTANIVGKRSVALFVAGGFVTDADVMRIAKIPYVQLFKVF